MTDNKKREISNMTRDEIENELQKINDIKQQLEHAIELLNTSRKKQEAILENLELLDKSTQQKSKHKIYRMIRSRTAQIKQDTLQLEQLNEYLNDIVEGIDFIENELYTLPKSDPEPAPSNRISAKIATQKAANALTSVRRSLSFSRRRSKYPPLAEGKRKRRQRTRRRNSRRRNSRRRNSSRRNSRRRKSSRRNSRRRNSSRRNSRRRNSSRRNSRRRNSNRRNLKSLRIK